MKKLRKVKRIVGIIGFTSFILLLGVVGGMEFDTITLIDGAIYSTIFLAFFGLSVMANNILDELQAQFRPYKVTNKNKSNIYGGIAI